MPRVQLIQSLVLLLLLLDAVAAMDHYTLLHTNQQRSTELPGLKQFLMCEDDIDRQNPALLLPQDYRANSIFNSFG